MSMPDANDIIDGLMREASLSKAIFHAAEAGLDLEVRGVRFVHERNLDSESTTNCAECAEGLGAYCDSLLDPLKAENAKLRELVRDMWEVIVHARDGVSYDKERELIDRMRELRVGVN